MAKVLVTGANGFLGSWLVRKLISDGHDVTAVLRKSSDISEIKGLDYKTAYGDVTDAESLLSAFKGQEIIYHLAGLIAYKSDERSRMEMVNVGGTKNVISAFSKNNCSKMLHLSSVVAIGAGFNKSQILTETSPYNVGHLHLGYFDTKHAAEKLVMDACAENRIHAVMVNPSTIYGAGDAKKGSRKTQLSVARGKLPIYTSGGVNVVAVEDVISGIELALKNGKTGNRYILSGENMTIKELFETIALAANVRPPSIPMPNFALHALGAIGDISRKLGVSFLSGISSENAITATLYHWFDCSKAKNDLGFKPTSSKEAIRKSVQWMQENGLLK